MKKQKKKKLDKIIFFFYLINFDLMQKISINIHRRKKSKYLQFKN